jgi:hypothetical protein
VMVIECGNLQVGYRWGVHSAIPRQRGATIPARH